MLFDFFRRLAQPAPAPAERPARPGVHDLPSLAAAIHTHYFSSSKRLNIRWGQRGPQRKKRRSIRLGSYDHRTSVIRIHPSLDAEHVPVFFIQSIIHHEYLHHVLGPAHDARFHRHERQFHHHREAKEWLKVNLPVLLGRKKKPVKSVVLRPATPRRMFINRDASPPPVQLSLFG